MKRHFEPSTITNLIRKLEENRDIHLTKNEKYVISEPVKNNRSRKIVELTTMNWVSKKDLKS
jgi:DNA-binding MarR family transcriptional regulator